MVAISCSRNSVVRFRSLDLAIVPQNLVYSVLCVLVIVYGLGKKSFSRTSRGNFTRAQLSAGTGEEFC